jgi:hypothetical protein
MRSSTRALFTTSTSSLGAQQQRPERACSSVQIPDKERHLVRERHQLNVQVGSTCGLFVNPIDAVIVGRRGEHDRRCQREMDQRNLLDCPSDRRTAVQRLPSTRRKQRRSSCSRSRWWRRVDSNHLPADYETAALAG